MKNFFKMGCLGLVGLFIFIIVIGLIFGEKETENASLASDSKKEEIKSEVKMTLVGEELKVGNVAFTVNEVSTSKEIKDAGGYLTYKPESEGAEFFILNLTIKNDGKEAITTDTSYFKLVNGDVEYSPTTIITTDSKFFLYDGINPGLSKKGNVLFEIPEGETNLILNVQTGIFGTEQGQIKLN